jgi:hypothetical protein
LAAQRGDAAAEEDAVAGVERVLEEVAVDARDRERDSRGLPAAGSRLRLLAEVVKAEGETGDWFPGCSGHVDTYIQAV